MQAVCLLCCNSLYLASGNRNYNLLEEGVVVDNIGRFRVGDRYFAIGRHEIWNPVLASTWDLLFVIITFQLRLNSQHPLE